ncbi:MAG: HU family DNA-binding protein [Rhodospirillaceae bacterium]
MNKNDLVAHVAAATGIAKGDATKAVDAVFDGITASLKAGGSVAVLGFGSFSVAARAARIGRNPRTGAEIKIAASRAPTFKAGKGLKDVVSG